MPQQRLYFEYVNKLLIPYWYVLTFKKGEINWDNPVHFYDAITPFNHVERDLFDSSLITIRIRSSDFVFNDYYPEKVGLNSTLIKSRTEQQGIDPDVVQQFILPTPEINDVLSMIPKERIMNFVFS